METFVYIVEGVDLDGDIPPTVRKAAMRAVNYATGKARTSASKKIRQSLNLPARYLTGAEGRLSATKATADNLEGVITGRRRATSLAQYSSGGSRSRGARVTVKPGVARYLKRGFLLKLRSGTDGSMGNRGLALRTDGAPPSAAFRPKKINDHLYLLYGPSVDTAFRRVIEPLTPDIEDDLATEFYRQLALVGL